MRFATALLLLLLASASFPVLGQHASASFGDPSWYDGFALPGVQRYIEGGSIEGYARTIAVAPDGDVYVGGYFFEAGGIEAHHVARWDGAAWYPLGSGTDNLDYGQPFGTPPATTRPFRSSPWVRAVTSTSAASSAKQAG